MYESYGSIDLACNGLAPSGGMERYTLDLLEGLVQLGANVRVFTRKADPTISLPPTAHVECRPYRWVPALLRQQRFSSWVGARRSPDRILVSTCRVAGADVMVCGGTHEGFLHASGKRPTLKDRATLKLERDAYTGARLIVAHSAWMVDELIGFYGVTRSKVLLLHPPVRDESFRVRDAAERQSLRRRFGMNDGAVHLLFPSSSHLRKGLDKVVSAIQRCRREIVVWVAGRRAELRSAAVRDLGFRSDIADLYAAADATILASTYEPFGLVAVESVLCGTPVLMSSVTGSTEVLSSSACRTFDHTREASIVAAIDALCQEVIEGHGRVDVPQRDVLYDYRIGEHARAVLAQASGFARAS